MTNSVVSVDIRVKNGKRNMAIKLKTEVTVI